MIAPVVRISPLTTIRRHRELPIAGEVVARKGQKVEAHHVVAEAYLQPRHLLLNIAHSLKVSPERADELIQRAAGELVAQGDLIAGPVGLMQRVVRAPKSGRIVVAGDGKVLLQLTTIPHELRAGMPGTVVSLIPERGVVIETTGALVQGVWGNGGADFGLLHSKLDKPDEQLTVAALDVSLRGAIVLGGYCADAAVFQRAADIPLRGLILTSMEAALIPAARKLSIPVVVLEGFGFHPLNTIGYNVLAGADGRQVALNAQRFDRFDGSRPEVIIPLESDMPPNEHGLEGEV
ncbi:MAG: hypothetical protein D6803_05295, partial [Anaerolineae bacterium]